MAKLITGLPIPICQHCGKQIKRTRGCGTVAMWQARKHCDIDCKMAASAKRKTGGA